MFFERLEFRSTSTKVNAVDSALIQAFSFSCGDHALQFGFDLSTLEPGVARVPELALPGRFPFRKRIATEIAENDLLQKTLEIGMSATLKGKARPLTYLPSDRLKLYGLWSET